MAERVGAGATSPPSFAHVPTRTRRSSSARSTTGPATAAATWSAGRGRSRAAPCSGRWGSQAARREPGLLTAAGLRASTPSASPSCSGSAARPSPTPERRAALWRDLAAGLGARPRGEAEALLAAAAGRLGGTGGLLGLAGALRGLRRPAGKKSFLFAKICARRGWLRSHDPESWEVCADNVLMRLALRSGLVQPGAGDEVRAATRDAFGQVAARRRDRARRARRPALGARPRRSRPARHRRRRPPEPPRDPASAWY